MFRFLGQKYKIIPATKRFCRESMYRLHLSSWKLRLDATQPIVSSRNSTNSSTDYSEKDTATNQLCNMPETSGIE